MAHRLNWSIGHRGKGIVSAETGDVHTWNVGVGGTPHHDQYAQNQNVLEGFTPFFIDADGYIHNNPFGPLSSVAAGRATMADPNLHTFKPDEDDWSLDPSMPGANTESTDGPDYNFVLGRMKEHMQERLSAPEEDYADMLKAWLDDIQPQDPPAPLSPHHQTPQDILPQAPVSPLNAPPYWPPGHVPDWADPASEGRTSAERPTSDPLPPEETTDADGGWLHDQTEQVVEREISPQEYDETLDEHVALALAKSEKKPRGLWLSRLFRRSR